MSTSTLPRHPLEDRLRTALIAARKRRGVTQEALAGKMGYPYAGGVGKVECKSSPLTLRFLLHAADALGVAAEEILAGAAGRDGGAP